MAISIRKKRTLRDIPRLAGGVAVGLGPPIYRTPPGRRWSAIFRGSKKRPGLDVVDECRHCDAVAVVRWSCNTALARGCRTSCSCDVDILQYAQGVSASSMRCSAGFDADQDMSGNNVGRTVYRLRCVNTRIWMPGTAGRTMRDPRHMWKASTVALVHGVSLGG